MRTIETKVIINAPKDLVWKVLMDQASYPEWNPFIQSLEGDLSEGQHIQVFIQPPEQKGMQFSPKVLVHQKEKEFRWKGKLLIKGLFDGEHYFRLEEMSNGQTQFIHGEHFRGALVGMLLKMIGESTLEGFKAMNEALKKRVELLRIAQH